jgi:hypothetical protein
MVIPPSMNHQFSAGIPYDSPQSPMGHYYPYESPLGIPLFSRHVLRIDQRKERQISHPNDWTMTGHAPRGSVDLVHNNLCGPPAPNFLAARQNMGANANVNMGGQQPRGINMGAPQGLPRRLHFSQDIPPQQVPAGIPRGSVQFSSPPMSPRHSIARQTSIQGLHPIPRRYTISHPNAEVQRPRNVSVHGLPPAISDSDNEEVGYSTPPPRHRAASAPIIHTIPTPGHMGHDPMLHPTTPTSRSMPPSQTAISNVVAPQSIDTSLNRRPYQYISDARLGQYPTMMNEVQLLMNAIAYNPKSVNMRPFVDILARRSPDELDALKANFNLVAPDTDLTVLFQQLLSREEDSVATTFIGLTLGPIMFDLWLLNPRVLITSLLTKSNVLEYEEGDGGYFN